MNARSLAANGACYDSPSADVSLERTDKKRVAVTRLLSCCSLTLPRRIHHGVQCRPYKTKHTKLYLAEREVLQSETLQGIPRDVFGAHSGVGGCAVTCNSHGAVIRPIARRLAIVILLLSFPLLIHNTSSTSVCTSGSRCAGYPFGVRFLPGVSHRMHFPNYNSAKKHLASLRNPPSP